MTDEAISTEAHVYAAVGILLWLAITGYLHIWWIFLPTLFVGVPATIVNLYRERQNLRDVTVSAMHLFKLRGR